MAEWKTDYAIFAEYAAFFTKIESHFELLKFSVIND